MKTFVEMPTLEKFLADPGKYRISEDEIRCIEEEGELRNWKNVIVYIVDYNEEDSCIAMAYYNDDFHIFNMMCGLEGEGDRVGKRMIEYFKERLEPLKINIVAENVVDSTKEFWKDMMAKRLIESYS